MATPVVDWLSRMGVLRFLRAQQYQWRPMRLSDDPARSVVAWGFVLDEVKASRVRERYGRTMSEEGIRLALERFGLSRASLTRGCAAAYSHLTTSFAEVVLSTPPTNDSSTTASKDDIDVRVVGALKNCISPPLAAFLSSVGAGYAAQGTSPVLWVDGDSVRAELLGVYEHPGSSARFDRTFGFLSSDEAEHYLRSGFWGIEHEMLGNVQGPRKLVVQCRIDVEKEAFVANAPIEPGAGEDGQADEGSDEEENSGSCRMDTAATKELTDALGRDLAKPATHFLQLESDIDPATGRIKTDFIVTNINDAIVAL